MKDFRFDPDPAVIKRRLETLKKQEEQRTEKLSELIGIYKLECIPAKSVYIGQSKNIPSRLKAHKSRLRGKSINYAESYPDIKRDYTLYGDSLMKFEPIHYCSAKDLHKWETYYIKLYREEGYTIYNKLHNTSATILNVPNIYQESLRDIIKALDHGKITPQQLQTFLDGLC